ncbi:MAG TPA: insulinase family protein, partial [Gemmatimonadaceae bacterium]
GDVTQSQLAIGWRTAPTLHPDTPALELLATVLGAGRASRLYRAVREQQLASSVSAYDYTPTELGVFVVHAEGQPEALAQAACASWAQILGARENGVEPTEVIRAQRILESRTIRRLEDMEGQANHLAEWEALGGWQLGDEFYDRLMACTADDVMRVARTYLDPAHASVLAYRPAACPAVVADANAMRTLLSAVEPAPVPTAGRRVNAGPTAKRVGAAFEREDGGARVYRTARGVPVLVQRKAGSPMAHVGVFVRGGATDEREDNAGLTSLMARTALKGTRTRSAEEIAEAGELMGGSVNAAAGGETFGWSVSVPMRRYGEAVELLADVTQHATFPDSALETERATAISEVIAMRDDMYRFPMRLAMRAAFPSHPYGVPTGGTEESLRAITGDAVRGWHASRALRSPAVIGVVGDADPDVLADAVAHAFSEMEYGDTPEPAAPEWPRAFASAEESRDKAQTALLMLFPGPGRRDDDRYAAGLIAGVASGLGGRFFDELREKRSLAYTVHAFASEYRLIGTFGAYIAMSPEREGEARAGLLAEFAKLCTEPVSVEELQHAQTYALGVHAIRLQRGGAVLSDLIGAWLDGRLAELSEFESRVRGVTRERMRDLAERYFDPARRVEGIVRGTGRAV